MSSRANNPTGSQQLVESNSGDGDTSTEEQSPAETSEQSEPESLSLDTIFEILKNQRRRYVLRYLRESDGAVQLNELADQVAAWENDKPVDLVSSNERKRVYVGLYQCHLTKMDDSGVIDFDQYRGTIEIRPPIQELYEYLDFGGEAAEEPSRAPTRFYSVAAGSAISLGLVGLMLPSISIGLHGFLLTAVLAMVVLGVTAAQEFSNREISLDPVPLVADERP